MLDQLTLLPDPDAAPEPVKVFIDPLLNCVPHAKWRWNQSCHLFVAADKANLPALHEFARRIGLRFEWRQVSRSGITHYDLNPSRRAAAVKAGAVEVTREEAAACFAAWRQLSTPRPSAAPDLVRQYLAGLGTPAAPHHIHGIAANAAALSAIGRVVRPEGPAPASIERFTRIPLLTDNRLANDRVEVFYRQQLWTERCRQQDGYDHSQQFAPEHTKPWTLEPERQLLAAESGPTLTDATRAARLRTYDELRSQGFDPEQSASAARQLLNVR